MNTGKGGGKKAGGGQGARQLKTRVRTAKGRKLSSTRWLQRQLNDPFIAEARRRGFRSRAALKLEQIQESHNILKPGMRVVDLGAAPGGWCQVAALSVRAGQPGGGSVLGVDLLEVDPIPNVTLLQMDFNDEDAPARIRAALASERVDAVLSDMAAPATGHKQTDHLRIVALCELALEFAREALAPGGAFLAKVLQGGTEHALLASMKRDFEKVRHVKPPASRADSSELYVLATGFRG